jgi:hypothetical protein
MQLSFISLKEAIAEEVLKILQADHHITLNTCTAR